MRRRVLCMARLRSLSDAQWSKQSADPSLKFQAGDISSWQKQCALVACWTHKAHVALATANGEDPTAEDLYSFQWPGDPVAGSRSSFHRHQGIDARSSECGLRGHIVTGAVSRLTSPCSPRAQAILLLWIYANALRVAERALKPRQFSFRFGIGASNCAISAVLRRLAVEGQHVAFDRDRRRDRRP